RAYFLLCGQKKVAKEKATPGSVPPSGVPCATRNAGRLAKLACGSDNASRLPPALLRCSAPLKGPGKTTRAETYGTRNPACERDVFDFGSPCAAPSNGAAGGKRARTV